MSKNEPAFPTIPKNHGYEGADGTGSAPGMSLRDYFAAKAMQTIIGEISTPSDSKLIAEIAYRQADAMLEERKAKKPPPVTTAE